MTQPTQEDIELIVKGIFGGKESHGGTSWILHSGTYNKKLFNPYIQDSITGALVKAVFPLLAEKGWYIEPGFNGIAVFQRTPRGHHVLTALNLNTALIEAYFKIEGEKK